MPEKRKMFQAGFTLIELIVVLIIVGILAGLAIPNYGRTRERALDREAQSGLRLIQAAERVYQSKAGTYLGTPIGTAAVNSNLQLELASTSWDFSVTAASQTAFAATAARLPLPAPVRRTWHINQDTSVNPTCTPGTGSCF
jgi:prepilin-type N-terminal cleavage/methylation domain-containing protein